MCRIVIRHSRAFEFCQGGERIATIVSVAGERNERTVFTVVRDDRGDCDPRATNERRPAFAVNCSAVDEAHLCGRNR
jgi:hypothetical protein